MCALFRWLFPVCERFVGHEMPRDTAPKEEIGSGSPYETVYPIMLISKCEQTGNTEAAESEKRKRKY